MGDICSSGKRLPITGSHQTNPPEFGRGNDQTIRLLRNVRMTSHLLLGPHERRHPDSATGADDARGSFHRAAGRQGAGGGAEERGTLKGQHGGAREHLVGVVSLVREKEFAMPLCGALGVHDTGNERSRRIRRREGLEIYLKGTIRQGGATPFRPKRHFVESIFVDHLPRFHQALHPPARLKQNPRFGPLRFI